MPPAAPQAELRWDLSLILSKMSAPIPPGGYVRRKELIERLNAGLNHRVTLVRAPAGFGKTALLSDWCNALREQGEAVAWLSLDEEDNDPQEFGAYVLAALRHAPNGVGQQAEAIWQQDPLTPVKTIMSVLLNEIAAANRKIVLILDDFDRLAARAIQTMISRLIQYAPVNFHVVMGVRAEPAVSFGYLKTNNQLLRIEARDLRFSVPEAEAFFRQAGLQLDNRSVTDLNDATEGWVAGLQLGLLAMREAADPAKVARDLASGQFSVDDYLGQTVLQQLPRATQLFLLRTSILSRLSGEVCDAIVGPGQGSWETLDWLESHNIFLRALDEERRWFSYHALMSDALRRRAALQIGSELPELHRRASTWFSSHGLWPEAVRHALAAGDLQQAADWVEMCAVALIDRSDVRMLLGWLNRLPHGLIEERPRLKMALEWARALSFEASAAQAMDGLLQDGATKKRPGSDLRKAAAAAEPDAAELSSVAALIAALADDSEGALALSKRAPTPKSGAPSWVWGFAHAAKIFGHAYAGQFDEVKRLREEAPAQTPEQGAPLYAEVYRISMWALSDLLAGKLDAAEKLFREAAADAEAAVGHNSAAATLPAGYLGEIYYERNELDKAAAVLSNRMSIALETSPLGSLLRFCRATSRLYMRRGDVGSALAVLQEGRDVAGDRGWLRLRAGCDNVTVQLLVSAGRIADAQKIVAELATLVPEDADIAGSRIETWVNTMIAQARVARAVGKPEHAAKLLTPVCDKLRTRGFHYAEAVARVQLALALDQVDRRAEASNHLLETLTFASTARMVGTYIDAGPSVLPILAATRKLLAADTPIAVYIDALRPLILETADQAPAGRAPVRVEQAQPSELLSGREVEILEHIANGLSNKEIARALRVAPETIKWHLKNIFEKLNVGSRIDAVQLGLRVTPAAKAAS